MITPATLRSFSAIRSAAPKKRARQHDRLAAADGSRTRTGGEAVHRDHLDVLPVDPEVIGQQIGRKRVLALTFPGKSHFADDLAAGVDAHAGALRHRGAERRVRDRAR